MASNNGNNQDRQTDEFGRALDTFGNPMPQQGQQQLLNTFGNPLPHPGQNVIQGTISVNSGYAWPNPYPQDPNYQYAAALQVPQPAPAPNQSPHQYQNQMQDQYQNPFHNQQFQTQARDPAQSQPHYQPQNPGPNQLPQGTPPQQGWLPPGPQPLGRTGLPAYFANAQDEHPHVNPAHPVRGIFYYINDGPQIPGEPDKSYRLRITYAVERMGIEHRLRPLPPDTNAYEGGYRNAQRLADESTFLVATDGQQADHIHKLKWGGNMYDAQYEAAWVAAKQKRQADNAARRFNAYQEVRNHLLQAGYDNLPQPDPADDSGDDLWDWGMRGPLPRKFTRLTQAERDQGLTQTQSTARLRVKTDPGRSTTRSVPYSGVYSQAASGISDRLTRERMSRLKSSIARQTQAPGNGLGGSGLCGNGSGGGGFGLPPPKRLHRSKEGYPSISHCERCKSLGYSTRKCGLSMVGVPCTECQKARAECLPYKVKSKPSRYAEWYPDGHKGKFPPAWYRNRSEMSENSSQVSGTRSKSASPRRDRDHPPCPGPSGRRGQYGSNDPRCYQCVGARRFCDMTRPCKECREHGEVCQDCELDDYGEVHIVGNRQSLPRGQDSGGYLPAPNYEHTQIAVDNPLTSGMGPSGSMASAHYPQPTPVDWSFGPASSLTNTMNAATSMGLGNPASATSVQQGAQQNWPSTEPQAASSPGAFQPPYDEDESFNFDEGDAMDVDYEQDSTDDFFGGYHMYNASPRAPGRGTTDRNLPEPEDHAPTQGYDPNVIDPNLLNPQPPPPAQTRLQPDSLRYNPAYDELTEGPVLRFIPEPQFAAYNEPGHINGCNELDPNEIARFWPNLADAPIDIKECERKPTIYCEAFDHNTFCFCGECRMGQDNFVRNDLDTANSTIRNYYCNICAATINNQYLHNEPLVLKITIDSCACMNQLEKAAICLSHRYNSVIRIHKRGMNVRARMTFQFSASKVHMCPLCDERLGDDKSGAWRCLACNGHTTGLMGMAAGLMT